MTTPTETAAGALLREQGARFDGFALHLDDLEPEDRAAALGEARAALASLAQHRDDIARALCYRALGGHLGGTVPADAPVCEPHRRDADAVLAYLTGEAS